MSTWRSLPPGRERRLTYDYQRRLRSNNYEDRGRRHVRAIPYIDIPYIQLQSGLSLKNLMQNSVCGVTERGCSELCVICQDIINYKQIYRKLNCTHQFHQKCIDRWFIDNTTCPLCKEDLSLES